MVSRCTVHALKTISSLRSSPAHLFHGRGWQAQHAAGALALLRLVTHKPVPAQGWLTGLALQATVLEAVLPLWADPQLAKLPRLHVIVVRILTQVRPSVLICFRPHWSLLGCLVVGRRLLM